MATLLSNVSLGGARDISGMTLVIHRTSKTNSFKSMAVPQRGQAIGISPKTLAMSVAHLGLTGGLIATTVASVELLAGLASRILR